jgi:hypothetical protein
VDIEGHEDGVRVWNVPQAVPRHALFHRIPDLDVAEAFSALGIFTPKGLRATSEIWGELEFVDNQDSSDAKCLTRRLLTRLDDEKLITDAAEDVRVQRLYSSWQFPMYDLDFSLSPVSMEELQRERDSLFFAEMGDPY